MGFFGGIIETKAAGGDEGSAISRAVSSSPSKYGMYSSVGVWDTDQAINNAFEKVMLIWRSIDAIASNASGIPIVRWRGPEDTGQMVEDTKLMQLLNIRPNSYEDAATLRYRTSALALLSRKGWFLECVPNIENVESIHVLPPQNVYPIPDAKTFVSGYRVVNAEQGEVELKPNQVIWGKLKPHPTDPYLQETPLVTLGITAETEWLARMFNRNFLLNDGRPGMLITVQGRLNADDAAEIKRRFSGGASIAGQTTVIEGEGMDVADLSASPRDAQWDVLLQKTKEDILLAFGVPESVMGNASGRTFDNADAEYEGFWQHTMKDHCKKFASALDRLTGNQYDQDRMMFDFSVVDVLQRQKRALEETIVTRWMQGAITWNEMRKGLGLDEWDSLAANIIVLPSGFAMAKNPADQAKIMELPNVGNMGAGNAIGSAMHDIAKGGAILGSREGARQLGNQLAARALQLAGKSAIQMNGNGSGGAAPFVQKKGDDIVDAIIVHPYLQEHKELESKIDGLLIAMNSRQEDVVLERLTHKKCVQFTRFAEEFKASPPKTATPKVLDPFYAVEVERWVKDTRDDFQRVLSPVMQREGRRVARDLDNHNLSAPTVPDRNAIISGIIDELLDVVDKSVRNQSNRIAAKIRDMESQGMTMEQIKKEVRRLSGSRSSWRKSLAGHITTAAYEGVRHDMYATAGNRVKKTWNTEDDEKVRDSHFFVDGQTKGMNGLFHVGETMMRRPGDPLAPVDEVAGCRCWLTYTM